MIVNPLPQLRGVQFCLVGVSLQTFQITNSIKSVNKLTDDGFQFAEILVFSDVCSVSRVRFPEVLGVILSPVLYPVALSPGL